MAERIYVGSGKERTFDGGGSIVTISVDVDKLIDACKDYGYTPDSGKRYIKLKVNQRRETDQYGNTHSVEVDTWKPDGAGTGNVHRGAFTGSSRQGQTGQGSTQGGQAASGYQKRPADARTGTNRTDETPPDFPDDIPF